MPLSLHRDSASFFAPFRPSTPQLSALALGLALAAASAAPAPAQEPASQTPPAQPAQSQPDPAQPAQADPAQQAPTQQTPAQPVPATTTPAAAQTQAPTPDDPQKQVSAPATYNTTTTVVPPSPAAQHSGPAPSASDSILEAELRTLLVDKPLFLRGCYSSDDLRFNERGGLYDSSPRGSFTLSGVQIERLRLTRKELILEGDRYGYRFLGALPGNNPTEDMERIKITPKKKVLRIRIEREEVISPKKEKEKPAKPESGQPPAPATAPAPAADTNVSESADNGPLKDEPVTVSPEHAVARLKETLARLFTPALDDRFVGSMPPFWQLYYKRLAAKSDYHPSDPSVLRQSQVDKKARLLSAIDPPSNAFAQDYGVAGMARYHVVVGPDGKPGEIAIGQPIGFGLDENAVDTLKKASFEPAVKDGKPVSVVLDLDVQFHIYSKLTSGTAKTDPQVKPALPGPYSLPSKP